MTTKERLHKLVDELSEAQAERALGLVEQEHDAKPGDIIDEWGNLSAMTRASSRRMLRRMDEEDTAAGFSWDDHL